MKTLRPMQLAAALLAVGGAAQAQLASSGPLNQFGYPESYTDSNGLTLVQGIDPNDPNVLLDPLPNPNQNPNVNNGNFWGEQFYWLCNADMETSGGSALLVLAIEGAWLNEEVIPGDQIVFSRIRIRVDVANTPASAGTYRVTHPFGEEVFQITAADIAATGGIRVINFTEDSLDFDPSQFGGPLNPASRVGPFLTWDGSLPAPPAGHIGNPNVLHAITGSPTGDNLFRVRGPGINPNGNNSLSTDLFSVQGVIGEPPAPPPGDFVIVCEGSSGCPCGRLYRTPVLSPVSWSTRWSGPNWLSL